MLVLPYILKKTSFSSKKTCVSERKAIDENSTTDRAWSSAKLFILKNYTTVADKDVSLTGKNLQYIFLIALKINMPTCCFGKKTFK